MNLGTLPKDRENNLAFIIKTDDKTATRCGFLAALSSVCDQLGLGAPFLLKGRLIIQRLCKNNANWDEPIDDTAQEWFKCRNNMMTYGKSIAKMFETRELW